MAGAIGAYDFCEGELGASTHPSQRNSITAGEEYPSLPNIQLDPVTLIR